MSVPGVARQGPAAHVTKILPSAWLLLQWPMQVFVFSVSSISAPDSGSRVMCRALALASFYSVTYFTPRA